MAKGLPDSVPCLKDRPGGRDRRHDVGATAIGTDGQAAADDLAEDRQVGRNTKQLLGAAGRDAEAGDDFIEDQHDVVLDGELTQTLEESVLWANKPHVGGHWFEDHRGYLRAALLQRFTDGVQIVVRQYDGVASTARGHTGAGRDAQRGGGRAGLDQ